MISLQRIIFIYIWVNETKKQGCSTLKDVLSCGLAGCFKVSARAGAVAYLFFSVEKYEEWGVQYSFQGASNGLFVAS